MHVEVAKVDLGWWFARGFVCECQRLVVEDVVEERILNVVPSENLRVSSLYGECFA
jgi:hypothetical protein